MDDQNEEAVRAAGCEDSRGCDRYRFRMVETTYGFIVSLDDMQSSKYNCT
jgi:hypothetical protein